MAPIDRNSQWQGVTTITKLQIDTTDDIVLKNGLLYKDGNPDPIPVEFIGDSGTINWEHKDTIITISNDQIIRYFKGMYFLNFKTSGDLWNVTTMSLDKNAILKLRKITGGDEEIEQIKNATTLTEIVDDEGVLIDYKIRPTKKELKEMLKLDIFKVEESFQKIRIVTLR